MCLHFWPPPISLNDVDEPLPIGHVLQVLCYESDFDLVNQVQAPSDEQKVLCNKRPIQSSFYFHSVI
jgi:hypothetical protein